MAGVRPSHRGGGAPCQGRLEGGDPRGPRDPRAGDASEELRIRAPGERHAGGKLEAVPVRALRESNETDCGRFDQVVKMILLPELRT